MVLLLYGMYQSSLLVNVPSEVSVEDRRRMESLHDNNDVASLLVLYEELALKHPHPFFIVQLAHIFNALRATSTSLDYFRRGRAALLSMNGADRFLDATLSVRSAKFIEDTDSILAESQKINYYQKWLSTASHPFPDELSVPPLGHDDIKEEWSSLSSAGRECYMRKLAIETNQIENVFYLTQKCISELVASGLDSDVVQALPNSPVHGGNKIVDILSDTIAAYELIELIVRDPQSFTPSTICSIHRRLMKTCRLTSKTRYITPGETRGTTRGTVIIGGPRPVQLCPFPEVDKELAMVCEAFQSSTISAENPFAAASWLHLIFVRCHPFEDGNGRMARILASIPLLKHGYPPICITLNDRSTYYDVINSTYDGTHSAMVQILLDGMREGLIPTS